MLENKNKILEHIDGHNSVMADLSESHVQTLLDISKLLTNIILGGGTVYLCGNGGSAADAQHVAGELVGRYMRERDPIRAIALTVNSSVITAIGNDYDFDQIFARQVQGNLQEQDVLVGISTSGKSPNVLAAIDAAKEIGSTTIGFAGDPGEPLAGKVDLCFCAPSQQTPFIQETHIVAWHIICELLESEIAGS